MALSTPILFIVFNRPDVTRVVFNAIREQKPRYLYVAADGPRANKTGEKESCEKVRSIVAEIDWDCEVRYLFQSQNLGCKMGVTTAITWFFEHVEEGIILEDDCLPNASFFEYCVTLLNYYRADERIFQINGCNHNIYEQNAAHSYYYSHMTHIWGWATWRRAWKHYDIKMSLWPTVKEGDTLARILSSADEASRRIKKYEETYQGLNDTWDYIWAYSVLIQHGLAIAPNVNMITNIGLAHIDSTHTLSKEIELAFQDMAFPIKHPPVVIPAYHLDDAYTYRHSPRHKPVHKPSLTERIKYKIKGIFGR